MQYSGQKKPSVTLSPICWNGKWYKYFQLPTGMLILPRGNGWQICMEVTYNDYAHTCLSPSVIIVSAPDSPYFLLFIFYRHSFHLLHYAKSHLEYTEWLEILLLPPLKETVWNCHISGLSAYTSWFSFGLRQHFTFIDFLIL